MKKTLFTITLLFNAIIGFSQTIGYGIKGGVNFSEQYLHNTYFQSTQQQSVTGFNVGGIMEFRFKEFSIQPGVFFTTKGEHDNSVAVISYPDNPTTVRTTENVKTNYIELPVNFLYRLKASKYLSVHLGGGPYIAYEFSASATAQNSADNEPVEKIKPAYNNPDYGLNLETGFTLFNKFIIDADYGLGLANLSNFGTVKNRALSFSVGYMFK